jgi:hypothetical protein
VEFDDNGYIRDQPVKSNRWQDIMPEMPVGHFITNHALPPGIQNFLDPAWCEQIIRECKRHADADNWLPSEKRWQCVLVRDLSVFII